MRIKKCVSLILAAVMVISMVGCGKKEVSQKNTTSNVSPSDSQEDKQALEVKYVFDENGELHIFATEEQIHDLQKKVVLTKDNWNEYYGDFDYIEHVVNKNAFGDIENEYDIRHIGFGPKKEKFISNVKDVAFKFDGEDFVIADDSSLKETYPTAYKCVFKAGCDVAQMYSINGEILDEKKIEIKDYYIARRNGMGGDYHYEEHNLIDVKGEVWVVDLPPEIQYDGEKIYLHEGYDDDLEHKGSLWLRARGF